MNLTSEQREHMEVCISRHDNLLRKKFSAGQAEHGGNLWEKPGMLRHAKEEHADLTAYLYTLEQQLLQLADQLTTGEIAPMDAALTIVQMVRG